MVFRVILVSDFGNGNLRYEKTFYRSKTRESSFIRFHSMMEKNKSVMFPKRFVNTDGIIPVKYRLCVSKIHEEGDIPRTLRDDKGKVYIEPKLQDWTILHSDDYLIEEKFWIFGMNSKKDRPTIKEVTKRLMVDMGKKNMIKQVIVVHNKLVIHNENYFEMVICKCIEDAQRLHHTFAKTIKKQKLRGFIFFGTATPATISRMYDTIVERTGWRIQKVRRTSTRY